MYFSYDLMLVFLIYNLWLDLLLINWIIYTLIMLPLPFILYAGLFSVESSDIIGKKMVLSVADTYFLVAKGITFIDLSLSNRS